MPKQTFEYNYFELPSAATKEDMLARLNAAGALGWQIASTYSGGGFYLIWMTREKSEPLDKPT